ncbi:MAG: hypothetical protein O9249_00135 [Burkholderiaceae bacterium]|nr:hypothetical protein [Burkholderiaceae bacterium]
MPTETKNEGTRMNNATLSFDYTGLALRNIRKTQHSEELAPLQVRATVAAIKFFRWLAPSLSAKLFAGIACFLIDRQTAQVARHVVFFEGVATRMERDIADTAVLPPAELVTNLEEFQASHLAHNKRRQELIDLLRSNNPHSRVALSFERLFKSLDDLCESAEALRYVASGEALEILNQRQSFLELRSQIQSGSLTECDDEMLALADDAIAASESRQLHLDAGWLDRMTRGPVH